MLQANEDENDQVELEIAFEQDLRELLEESSDDDVTQKTSEPCSGAGPCSQGFKAEQLDTEKRNKRPLTAVGLQRLVSLEDWVQEAPVSKRPKIQPCPSLDSWLDKGTSLLLRPHPEEQPRVTSPRPLCASTADSGQEPDPARSSSTAAEDPAAAGDLEQLPQAVLSRILCCLSAESLVSLAQTSKSMRAFASDDSLWRRLYVARWGRPNHKQLQAYRLQGAVSWKSYYMRRDAKEAGESLERIPEDMRAACQQMHLALRKTTVPLDPNATMDGLAVADAAEADRVVQWRRQHGLPDTVAFHSCVGPGKPPQGCKYARVGDALVCERTGWAHICDDTCTERIVNSKSGMMVCPISGRCFDTMMTEAEEAAEAMRAPEVQDDDYFEKGTLGRSFQAGYSCSNERDLQLFCGVKLS
uniref:F-box protein skip31-like n=1 Tax=Tetraselmis sp. GSL018 TaxID=582737 RepID=A0A061RD93_9CHLO